MPLRRTHELWRDLPRELVALLQTLLVDLDEDDTYTRAVSEVAEHARVHGHELDAATRANIAVGTRAAVQCFLRELSGEGASVDRALFVAHGRAQHDAGRALEEMFDFYSLGALVIWRRLVTQSFAPTLTSEQLGALAEAVFAFTHDLSAAGAEGYSQAHSESASTREGRRERLLQLLMSERTPPAERVLAEAQLAGWKVPQRLAAVAIAAEHAECVRAAVGASALTGRVDDAACVLIPADETLEWQLARVVDCLPSGTRVALGEVHEWGDARASLHSAVAAAALAPAGASVTAASREGRDDAHLVRAEDMPVLLLLASDARLGERIGKKHLAPLRQLDASARERLTETLRAWLDTPGQPQAVANRLGVHVQTVRYRLRQLHALFGKELEDPDRRFELAVALRVARLHPQVRHSSQNADSAPRPTAYSPTPRP